MAALFQGAADHPPQSHPAYPLFPPWKTLISRSSTDWSWCDQPAVSVCCSLFLDGSRNVRFVLTLVWQLLLDVKNRNVLHYYFFIGLISYTSEELLLLSLLWYADVVINQIWVFSAVISVYDSEGSSRLRKRSSSGMFELSYIVCIMFALHQTCWWCWR